MNLINLIWNLEKKRLMISAIILLIGIGIGVLFGNMVNVNPSDYYKPVSPNWYELAVNNIGAALLIAISGILFTIPTIILLFLNGLILGFTIVLSLPIHSVTTIIAALLPHGILEIPALILAGAIGLKPFFLYAYHIKFQAKIKWKKELLESAAMLSIVIILLLAASLIEAYITPTLMSLTR